jgi:uncharacterized paraquat-inducible protein A
MLAILAHMTKEQSDAIGMLVLTVAVAAAVVLALLVWAVVAATRRIRRRSLRDDPDDTGNDRSTA